MAERDVADVVKGCTSFATALYGEVARGSGNVFLAPASVSAALAMTYAGARRETAAEMARVLHVPATEPPRIHVAFAAVLAASGGAPGVELSTACALFGQSGFGFLPGFVALLAERYGSGLREVDFAGATEEARREINAWVTGKTRGRILDLLPCGVLSELTRLVLVSAIFFKGSWAAPFQAARTRKQPFHLQGGGSVPAMLMVQTSDFKLADVPGARVMELPYEGCAISMVVVLPKGRDVLPAVEAKLASDLEGWLTLLDRARSRKVEVFLPRFRIDVKLQLKDALVRLGMPLAFDEARADFSGMTGRPDLCVGAVVHGALIEVDELGTTAAAATGVVGVMKTGIGVRPDVPVFRADHPFLFLIRDKRTGSVLFLGRLMAP